MTDTMIYCKSSLMEFLSEFSTPIKCCYENNMYSATFGPSKFNLQLRISVIKHVVGL